MQAWKAAEPRKLIPKRQQKGTLAPPNPAKPRAGGIRQWRVEQDTKRRGSGGRLV